ncbi:MAG: hypothetical protein RJA59_2006 [Pseudomonadota bacterium]
MATTVRYVAEPTAARFHASKARRKGIMGPVGCGKSSACAMELWRRAMTAPPCTDGVRRTRIAVVRNTYGELKTTTLKDFQDWIPPEVCRIVYDSPIRGELRHGLADGTAVDCEVWFFPLDSHHDVRKLLSMSLTGAWINEAREISRLVVDGIDQRIGRFPPKRLCPTPPSPFLIMDTNPPSERHWWHELAECDTPEGWEFFRQPPAVRRGADGALEIHPKAEGVRHQPMGERYWIDLAPGKQPEWVRVYLEGEYGSVFAGLPVYGTTWSAPMHTALRPLPVLLTSPLVFGVDTGLKPAIVMGQRATTGQLRILRCWHTPDSSSQGMRQLLGRYVMPDLREFPQALRKVAFTDVAAVRREDADSDVSALSVLQGFGFEARQAPTNALRDRVEAVEGLLSRMAGPGEMQLIVDPHASNAILRDGFNGGYRYRQLASSVSSGYSDAPDKNVYSHIHDALQYLALGVAGRKTPAAPREVKIVGGRWKGT